MPTQWDKKRSLWYCQAVDQSNYPKKAVSQLLPLLRTCESVLDMGAGCGALSLPVAKRVRKVTAIEPSRWMYRLLLKRARQAGIDNIRACNTGWKGNRLEGQFHHTLKPHDMVVCANLPRSVICSARFLGYITTMSTKYIVYIQNARGWNRFYYRELYPMLLNREYSDECDYINTYTFLYKKGITAHVKIFDYRLDQHFRDFDEAMDFWRHRLKTRLSAGQERMLADFLRKKLVRTGRSNSLTAPFGSRKTALMWWKP